MDCERFDKMSLELLYDELDELTAAATRRHLHHCTRCQGIWAKLRVTRDLSEIPFEEPPQDLFQSILDAEQEAHKRLPFRERFGRTVSILAGYAMRPQLAMAALLVLMIGSSLVFVRTTPNGRDQVGVLELGAPSLEVLQNDPGARLSRSKAEQDGEDPPEPGERSRGASPAAPAAAPPPQGAVAEGARAEKNGYRDAMTAYQEGRYAEAERLFSEVAAAGGEKAAAAALHEAHSARNGSGCQRAAALYDQVTASYSGSTVADEAAWQAATCYQALGQLERARAHYRVLASRPAYAARADRALAQLEPRATADAAPATAFGSSVATDEAKAAKAAEAAPSRPAASSAGAPPPAEPAKPAESEDSE